jgi:glyoxylase-like metal-dependent hydrolase (beta-lactamase superfamily II)
MANLSWRVGDVRITRIVEGDGSAAIQHVLSAIPPQEIRKLAWLHPHFVDDDWNLRASIHTLVIETPDRRIVVDTCVGNDKERPKQDHWHWHRAQTRFMDDLVEAGFHPDSIDTVMCTHLHMDHVGWNTRLVDGQWVPTFPKARYLFAEKELRHWQEHGRSLQQAVLADSVTPVLDAGLAEMVTSDHRVCPEVCLIPTPGHTPGHVSVLIESKGEAALITGDFIHHPCQLANPDWVSSADSDAELGKRSRWDTFRSYADRPLLMIGTHFAGPTAGKLVRDGDVFRLDV